MHRIALLVCLCGFGTTSGCTYVQDLSIAAHNRAAAENAWRGVRRQYRSSGMSYMTREHFARGFVQGYYDVAGGSNGAVPLFPPQSYWGAHYQTPEGIERVNAWFRGYQEGAVTALNSGMSNAQKLPTSWNPSHGVPHEVPDADNPPIELLPPGA
jgi:hypothetical protein